MVPLFVKFMEETCRKGAVALEEGDRASHIHLQCVAEIYYPAVLNANTRRALGTHIKAALGVQIGSSIVVSVKELTGKQSFGEMLGYVQKDRAKPNFRIWYHNVTKAELLQGQEG
jgi:hypothetical protein